jgi:ribosomal protein S18 acetylase RimI-like enzyme
MTMKLTIAVTRCGETDAHRVAVIGRETFYDTWRPVNTEEDMQAYLAEAFAEDVIRRDLGQAANTFLLATVDGADAGYAKLRRDRRMEGLGDGGALEIERIYVRREMQGKKVGVALMAECIRIAEQEGCRWLWLGVNMENEKAIRFYRQYGFEVFGVKQFRLGAAVDDDYLMKMSLPGSGAHSG